MKKNLMFGYMVLSILLSIWLAGTAMAQENHINYRIGPEDILRIYVWNHTELSITVPVRIDGKISIPLVNDIQASGLTPMELTEKITEKLKKYIEEPTVSVIIETINSQKIVIAGNVNAPGVYRVGSLISLMEAIAKAGSLGEWANAKKVKVLRKKNKKEEIIVINYANVLNGKNLDGNILIYPGDSIIVP